MWGILGALVIIILLLSWVIFFGGAKTFQNFLGDSILFQNQGEEEYETPPENETLDCTDFNIGNEYREEFGLTAITAAKKVCEGAGGYWRDARDELSCTWPPPTEPFDCRDYEWIEGSKDFCVEELAGFFYCSPNVAYIGCYCQKEKPEDCMDLCGSYGYDFGEFIPNDGSECDWGTVKDDYCCCWDEEGGNGQDGDEEVTCDYGLTVPEGTGDAGGWCAEHACSGGLACDNYVDKDTHEQMCACTENYFCQPCYEYFYTVECECPPGYYEELVTKSSFWCVPEGGECQ